MVKTIRLPIMLSIIRKANFPKKLGILERLFGGNLKRNGICWVNCSNQILWKLDLNDPCHRWIIYGKYEGGNGIDFAYSKLKNGGIYVDSGANIGQWLLYLGHTDGVRSLAFEPVSSERKWLKECVDVQNRWNVDIMHFGLGSKNTELEIQNKGARSTLQMDWYKGKNYTRELIKVRRLEDVLDDMEIGHVAFWKLDVEGTELEALEGAEKYLREQKIGNIFFECHPLNYKNICKLLSSFDYRVFDLVGKNLVSKSDISITKTENLVAVPS